MNKFQSRVESLEKQIRPDDPWEKLTDEELFALFDKWIIELAETHRFRKINVPEGLEFHLGGLFFNRYDGLGLELSEAEIEQLNEKPELCEMEELLDHGFVPVDGKRLKKLMGDGPRKDKTAINERLNELLGIEKGIPSYKIFTISPPSYKTNEPPTLGRV